MINRMTDPTIIRRDGREIVADGRLRQLRERLGLTRTAMADLLQASPISYGSWEDRPNTVRLWPSTAERISRFYASATRALDMLDQQHIEVDQLVPLHMAATQSGIPQELLLKWYRDGQFDAVDLGILGLWLYRRDVPTIGFPE